VFCENRRAARLEAKCDSDHIFRGHFGAQLPRGKRQCRRLEKTAGIGSLALAVRSPLPGLQSGRSAAHGPRLPARYPKLSRPTRKAAAPRTRILPRANARREPIWFFGRAVARSPAFPRAYRPALLEISRLRVAGRIGSKCATAKSGPKKRDSLTRICAHP